MKGGWGQHASLQVRSCRICEVCNNRYVYERDVISVTSMRLNCTLKVMSRTIQSLPIPSPRHLSPWLIRSPHRSSQTSANINGNIKYLSGTIIVLKIPLLQYSNVQQRHIIFTNGIKLYVYTTLKARKQHCYETEGFRVNVIIRWEQLAGDDDHKSKTFGRNEIKLEIWKSFTD